MTQLTFRIESLKAVAPFMSKEQTRYYLNGVFFQNGLMIATEGHRMAVIKDTGATGTAPEFILPAETVEKLLKTKPDSKRLALFVSIDTEAKIATAFHEIKDERLVMAQFPYTPIDGTFPDWRRVIPQREGLTGGLQGFNTDYLAAFKSFGKVIALYTNAERGSPAVICGKTDQFEAFGVLMPVREDFYETWPGWISGISEEKKVA